MPNITYNDDGTCSENDDYEFNSVVGVQIDSVIEAADPPGPTVDMTFDLEVGDPLGGYYERCDSCTDPELVFGITVAVQDADADTVKISGTPTQATSLRVTVVARSNGIECVRKFLISVVRYPVDLGLVLDKSGSMNSALSPPHDTRSRWKVLMTGVAAMENQLKALARDDALLDGDTLGLRMFDGEPVRPGSPFDGDLVAMDTYHNQLTNALDDVTPGGSTALGDGILAVRDMLEFGDDANSKAMITFSDGMQNTGDQVQTTGSQRYTHTYSGEPLRIASEEETINIYTISLAPSGYAPDLMNGIADKNGGIPLNVNAGEEDELETLFQDHLLNILSGSTPQYIDVRRGAFPANAGNTPRAGNTPPSTIEAFPISRGARSVVVTLFAPSNAEPKFISITKDGTELIQHVQQTSGPGFIAFSMRYQIDSLPNVTLDGDWVVEAQLSTIPKRDLPYRMTIVADDHIVRASFDVGASRIKVNDVLSTSVTLLKGAQPIENAEVTALVLKPGEDIDDLIARADVDFSVEPGDPGSPSTAKLARLLQDPDFRGEIKVQDQVISLPYDAAADVYEGSFSGTDVAGVYQVIHRISVDDPDVGKVRRYHHQSVYVRFEDVDMDKSEVSVGQDARGNTTLTWRPQSSRDKYIGPGWGPAIGLDAPNATISDLTDHGDGRYTLVLSGSLSGSGQLFISDEKAFDGDLERLKCFGPSAGLLQRIQCWLLGLGLPTWAVWVILLLVLILLFIIFV
jgi:hypothetical protein